MQVQVRNQKTVGDHQQMMAGGGCGGAELRGSRRPLTTVCSAAGGGQRGSRRPSTDDGTGGSCAGSVASTGSYSGLSARDYFTRKHGEALRDVPGNRLARRVCAELFGGDDTPWDGARPVEDVLVALSAESGGGDAKPTFENLTLHRGCVDAVFLELAHNFGNPNASRAIWRVCRVAKFLLLDRRIANSRWLTRIRAVDDHNVVSYLIGSDVGIVSSVLAAFAGEFATEQNPDLRRFMDDRGTTNVFELSNMFCRAAADFPVELLQTRALERERRVLIASSIVDVFEVAFLNADFRAHVPDGRIDLVSGLRSASAAAALSDDRVLRVTAERDELRGTLATITTERNWFQREVGRLMGILDGIGCCARFLFCIPNHRRTPTTEETPLMSGVASINSR